jgi:hypothetical protein
VNCLNALCGAMQFENSMIKYGRSQKVHCKIVLAALLSISPA